MSRSCINLRLDYSTIKFLPLNHLSIRSKLRQICHPSLIRTSIVKMRHHRTPHRSQPATDILTYSATLRDKKSIPGPLGKQRSGQRWRKIWRSPYRQIAVNQILIVLLFSSSISSHGTGGGWLIPEPDFPFFPSFFIKSKLPICCLSSTQTLIHPKGKQDDMCEIVGVGVFFFRRRRRSINDQISHNSVSRRVAERGGGGGVVKEYQTVGNSSSRWKEIWK